MLEDDHRQFEKKREIKLKSKYRPIISSIETIEKTPENQDMLLCMNLTKDIFKARKIYNRMDIVRLWELLTLVYAKNYKDPFADEIEEEE